MDKKTYYQDEKVVSNYDDWRFGSEGGRYVSEVEVAAFVGFLDNRKDARLLDMPCGTGRLTSSLLSLGYTRVEGGDASPAMLRLAEGRLPNVMLREVDALHTPYEAGRFDCVCSLRFLFHLRQPEVFFAEVFRLLNDGGIFIFDSLVWTPRNVIPFINHWLGGSLYTYGKSALVLLLRKQGFEILEIQHVFLLPTQVYRFLPKQCVTWVHRLEQMLPKWLCSKLIVAVRKNAKS